MRVLPTKFANRGEKRGRFCGKHKQPGMVDVKSKQCEFEGCESISPACANRGEKRGRFCGQHKAPGMVDVVSKRCEFEGGCESNTPSFANRGEKRGRFCGTHKAPGMVDVVSKQCEFEGCESLNPNFANRGERGRFCKKKKKAPDMVDVKNKRCEFEGGCGAVVSYGVPGLRASRCAVHKLDGMLKSSRSKCETCKTELALFGIRKPQRCEAYRLAHDVNLVERTCVVCALVDVLDADGKCDCCAMGRRGMLAKQKEVMQFLDVAQ